MKRLGVIKFYTERILGYIQRILYVPTLLASFTILGISYWWLVLLPVLFYIMYWFDKKYIVEAEIQESFRFGKKILKEDGYEWKKINEHTDTYLTINKRSKTQQ